MVQQQDPATHFGGRLRAAREARGMSLREISNVTKISMGVLDALERNDFTKLPGGLFSRAFIRSYAAEVGIDPERAIDDFVQELSPEARAALYQSSQQDEPRAIDDTRGRTARVAVLIVVLAAVAAGGVYLAGLVRHAAPAEPTASREAIDRPTPGNPSAAASVEATSAATAIQRPAASEPVTTSTTKSVDVPDAQRAPDGHPVDARPDPLTIVLEASRDCWVAAVVDGNRTPGSMLRSGQRRTIGAKQTIALTAGDAGALAVTVNGLEARQLGSGGQVVTTRFTTDNFREYLTGR